MTADPFAPLSRSSRPARSTSTATKAWSVVMPVPADAPAAPTAHPKLGTPTTVWTYRDADGALLGYVHRYDSAEGKEFRPLTYMRNAAGTYAWRWESWPAPRPLYGLQELAQRPRARVVICEGEKATDAARKLLSDYVAVTAPGGAKAAAKADWSPLRGRSIVLWPDADTAGYDYATETTKMLGAAEALDIAVLAPPAGARVGWDAADALAEGWTSEQVLAQIGKTATVKDEGDVGVHPAPAGRRRVPQRDILVGLTEACELWHDAGGVAYVTMPVNAHRENWPVRSSRSRQWLSGEYYNATGSALGGQALEDGIRILEARAINDGAEHEPWLRVGRHGNKLYLDLCDKRWRAVEIAPLGWHVVEHPPVKFIRSPASRPLPDPEAGSLIEELRRFVNVSSDGDFTLLNSWLVTALRERGPYPVLCLNGEQGSGKSGVSRMLRLLVDPSAAPIRAVPKDDRDLVVSAGNSWVLAYDNLSAVPAWLSDALCRLATGSGFATRSLYQDKEESIFEAARPIILNGIGSLTDRADLADRSITIHLAAIPEEQRRPEDELWSQFEERRPYILGALLDAVSAALRNIDKVKLDRSPRMADYAKWITAAAPGLGIDADDFMQVYRDNRRNVAESSFEADPVAVAVKSWIENEHPTGWSGTATELLAALNGRVPDKTSSSRLWPMSATAMGNKVERVAPLLRAKGFKIERRHSGVRTIVIVPPMLAE
jgi:putative DNA primase/helicase